MTPLAQADHDVHVDPDDDEVDDRRRPANRTPATHTTEVSTDAPSLRRPAPQALAAAPYRGMKFATDG